ncbi:MarR family winged helix-turn-helix transcriptional regulator [Methylorubrum sp. SL192]|uniref:MarR family winged helix-turn-helix transcriptional regulator n=1 Tax=Methylorubrum sp. SL192 TaxID=2995167 RepID=UPI0022731FD2|nr:MarR family winged helix-turn-helix transcriptional regulator [Methylorubrum sp. SL192]MCY1643461.1 MarR family winged helix-turn-helix transcriptional regulator [Methylorubrum sp. SL192]
MARDPVLTPTMAASVERSCYSFAAQKAARAIGRRYDAALRPTGLSNWQFTLLMMLVREEPPTISALAQHLATDRTTITANLKPLERRGLVTVQGDAEDRRVRRVVLSEEGRTLLAEAYPLWQQAQATVARQLGKVDQDAFRAAVMALSA